MLGKPTMEVDQKLLESTGSIGDYSGIALGVDRLAMVLLGCSSIVEVFLYGRILLYSYRLFLKQRVLLVEQ